MIWRRIRRHRVGEMDISRKKILAFIHTSRLAVRTGFFDRTAPWRTNVLHRPLIQMIIALGVLAIIPGASLRLEAADVEDVATASEDNPISVSYSPPGARAAIATCSASRDLMDGRRGRVWDGADGIDVAEIGGPSYHVMDGRRLKSFEKIDIENGAFDTFAFLRTFIDTAENDEIEVVADRFDTIVLDPFLEWSRTADAANSRLVFEALADGQALRVLTALDAYVVGPAEDAVMSTGRLRSDYSRSGSGVANEPWIGEIGRPDDARYLMRWSSAGTVTPETLHLAPEHGAIELDMRNGLENRMRLDLTKLVGPSERILDIISDPDDEIILVQSECWSDAEPIATESDFDKNIRPIEDLPFVVSAQFPTRQRIVA